MRELKQGKRPQVFLQSVPGGGLIASPGTPRVNNPANDTPDCIEPPPGQRVQPN